MANAKKLFIIDNKLPYYVHQSEGPRVPITNIIFNGEKYELWQKALCIALKAKKKSEFIDVVDVWM